MKKVSSLLILLIGLTGVVSAQTVQIGTQEWTSENLNVDKFRNGDPIPHAKTNEDWAIAEDNKQPAWCYYNYDPANGEKYGKLYNWWAVNDPRGLAPDGWHIPSDEEWTVLTDYLGGEGAAGKKMKSPSGWYDNGNGNNESGFSALPGGIRHAFETFLGIGSQGYWWSSTEDDTHYAWNCHLDYYNGDAERDNNYKEYGLSVRCLKD